MNWVELVEMDELVEMVQEADIDGDQHVSFEEFRDIFNEG